MHKLLFLFCLLTYFVVFLGCSATPVNEEPAIPEIPDWFINPKLKPGKAFYARGVYILNPVPESTVEKLPDKLSKSEICDSIIPLITEKISCSVEYYAKGISTESEKRAFIDFMLRVMNKFSKKKIYVIHHVNNAIKEHKNKLVYYALSKLDLDNV